MGTKLEHTNLGRFQEILKQKQVELIYVLRVRDGIAIEKSADPMDEIQYATERDLAICSADLDSNLLREVSAALRRVHDGSFGVCVECKLEISPKRLAAVPWASRCIRCQDTSDQDTHSSTASFGEALESYA